jgi:colanic acid biosynthesis protein WcaH
MSPAPLTHGELSTVVRLAPLVTIDLIISNSGDEILLGMRNNEPARDFWFVPGGSIWKNERLRDAFARILKNETNLSADFDQARLMGVYEHIYAENRFGDSNYGTHCLVLGYHIKIDDASRLQCDPQHSEFRWWRQRELATSKQVHPYTRAYFTEGDLGI